MVFGIFSYDTAYSQVFIQQRETEKYKIGLTKKHLKAENRVRERDKIM